MITQYPLFKENKEGTDIDLACKYIVNDMLKKGNVAVMRMDDDLQPECFTAGKNDKTHPFMRNFISGMVMSSYGYINMVQMANFLLVEEFVINKVLPALMSYMSHISLNCKTVQYIPAEVMAPILIDKLNKGIKPISYHWDPNERWDFDIPVSKADDILMNPLNKYIHLSLFLNDVSNKRFLADLTLAGILTRQEVINTIGTKGKFENLELKLLPYNNFNKVLNIVDAIFKHY